MATRPNTIVQSSPTVDRSASIAFRFDSSIIFGRERCREARLSTAVTCTGVQTPSRAVATPRALSAFAIVRNDVAPPAFICSMIGSTLAAKRIFLLSWAGSVLLYKFERYDELEIEVAAP